MTLCPTPRKGTILAEGPSWKAVDQVACKKWDCPICGHTKAFLLRTRIKGANYNRFITLTHRPIPGDTPESALRRMRHDWHTLHKALQRRQGKRKIAYVAVVEWTKNGWPHLHILYKGKFIRQQELSNLWNHIHGAPIVDIRKITTEKKEAEYISKYLTKDNRCPPRMRRWSATRGFLPQLPPYINPAWPEDTTYRYLRVDAANFALQLDTHGWTSLEGPKNTIIMIDVPTPYPQERSG